ncbi:LEAF RUST 10 DISEASE-RESISTANCE LOCUS RECEPTOR-LIKE PROTEIN KINASE-like 2.1 [Alnus glutinosa]|uniref:LEAF RUST 10 DISEASE-RESISTANCE LOCUS RECEPTOR-LIKE PROTEIN KINASE-like 2.1 n=1 Tax=Alnus glutinosa TaxID=3517 RepID=UPI002D765E2B|nr:LEAF RUST 10 DISEASE-RESISTANCE LOCUS RECEPTOR-LIKE PROTEIN KINASE-like 2.1 [Alnus glutinosa]
MSQPLSLLLLILSLFFLHSLATNSTSFSPLCAPHHCGDVLISYPFWLHDDNATSDESYCGYKGFGLTCPSVGEKPILALPGNTYHVKEIDYTQYTLTLVDIDTANQSCPRVRQNVTLGTLPLNFSGGDLNLSFYFNCSSSYTALVPVPYIGCLGVSYNGNRSFVFVEGEETAAGFEWASICQEKVVATVMRTEIDLGNLTGGFIGAIKNGFGLNWKPLQECGTCESSGGYCGYNSSQFLCLCKDGSTSGERCKGSRSNFKVKLIIGLVATALSVGVMMLTFCCFKRMLLLCKIIWKKESETHKNVEAFLRNNGPLAIRRYSYSDIKNMTNLFKNKLGEGGFGGVYKGKLQDGCLVAVKVLKESRGNGEDFINEVASISRTSHVNIVTLMGFCFEGSKRALIYEFMPNGSLEKFIYKENPSKADCRLEWETIHKIALGIARGLEYLHRGCNTRILHFDIKPHNILLDENFCPKISDFGLAKICAKEESIISMSGARGTPGYVAPELICRNFGRVSHKSDVYSYGMMVSEMVWGRKNIEIGVDRTSELFFPHWIYKRLELDEELGLHGLMNEEDKESAKKLIIVSLWCIQTDPSNRPSMSRVVDMLKGSLDSLQIPPKPFLSSPPISPVDHSTTMESSQMIL